MVTVYTQPRCPACRTTKSALDAREIEYNEVDITEDSDALELVLSKGFKQAPVVITDEDSWSGHQPDKINSLQKEHE